MDCRIVNTPVKEAAEKIKGAIFNSFLDAGTTFVDKFTEAIEPMRGEAKEELEAYFNESFKDLVSNEESGIPGMIKGLGDLLEMNRTQFASTDHTIAAKIKEARGK